MNIFGGSLLCLLIVKSVKTILFQQQKKQTDLGLKPLENGFGRSTR